MNHSQRALSLNDQQNVSIAFPAGMEGCVVNYGTANPLIGLLPDQNDKQTVTRPDNISEE